MGVRFCYNSKWFVWWKRECGSTIIPSDSFDQNGNAVQKGFTSNHINQRAKQTNHWTNQSTHQSAPPTDRSSNQKHFHKNQSSNQISQSSNQKANEPTNQKDQPIKASTSQDNNRPLNKSTNTPISRHEPTNRSSNQNINKKTTPATNQWGCLRRIWLGQVSRSIKPILHKINPNPRKNNCCGKKWPKCHSKPIFSWVGLALGWGVRRFHNVIYMFSDPTQGGKSQPL